MKIRFLSLLLLLLTFTAIPVFAHGGNATTPDAGHTSMASMPDHGANASLHEKINQLLKSIPGNADFVVTLESKTTNDLLLDVRSADSSQKDPIKDALHISITDLHDHVKELPTDKKVFVIGESTVEGAYAVFVLRLHGVDGWLVKTKELPSGCPLQNVHNQQHPPK